MLAMVSIHHNNMTNYRGCIDISNVVEKRQASKFVTNIHNFGNSYSGWLRNPALVGRW
jgi:hypothetical protein